MTHIRCPVCRNKNGDTADGIVVSKYRPVMKNGKVVNKMAPLHQNERHCPKCGTVLLVRRRGEWVLAHRVK